MNIFEERNFNAEDRTKLKNVIESAITALEEIKDLTDSMNDDIKSRCESLNEGIDDKRQPQRTRLHLHRALRGRPRA